ncbi:hypothetical protein V6N13_074276 [Hibiscus sabdariffa]|uniref:Uncharacterized protein n=1 Tax=Hibiscus sabdariffa TaxID=183260 RepID=A0ABR2U8D5_9ROSI
MDFWQQFVQHQQINIHGNHLTYRTKDKPYGARNDYAMMTHVGSNKTTIRQRQMLMDEWFWIQADGEAQISPHNGGRKRVEMWLELVEIGIKRKVNQEETERMG